MAPPHNTIRSAVNAVWPCGPIASTPTATLPAKRSRTARVRACSRRFGRLSAGMRYRRRTPAHSVDDVERDGAYPRNRFRCNVVEVGDPAESGALGGGDETVRGPGHLVGAAHQDGSAVAVGGTVEVQVGLDGPEAVQHLGPSPAR